MRLTKQNLTLLGISIGIDAVQGYLFFQEALCAIPSISGVGIIATIACWLGSEGIDALGVAIWYAASLYLVKRRLSFTDPYIGLAVVELVPGVSALPLFTMAAIKNIWVSR